MELLYHYTNIDGLRGILGPHDDNDDVKLWFTNAGYLNDVSEGDELDRIYKKVCIEMKDCGEICEEEYKEISDVRFNKRGIIYTSRDDKTGKNMKCFNYGKTTAYICCFCRNGDSLNMWRYYTKNNTGCAICFIDDRLKIHKEREQFMPKDTAVGKFEVCHVTYDDAEKEKIIHSEIQKILRDLDEAQIPRVGNLKKAVTRKLSQYEFKFKDACFSSEEEVRAIYYVPNNNNDLPEKRKNKIKYRSAQGLVVPYIEINFPREIMREVCIAPNASEEAVASIKNYLETENYNVPAKQSKLPVRF